ncbi:hypothetical protein [Natroniella sulfidigena]|nr:hypothetical protein [Natroniella sulfidigena]
MVDIEVKYADLDEHQERKLMDMEDALNSERDQEPVIILAVEEMN